MDSKGKTGLGKKLLQFVLGSLGVFLVFIGIHFIGVALFDLFVIYEFYKPLAVILVVLLINKLCQLDIFFHKGLTITICLGYNGTVMFNQMFEYQHEGSEFLASRRRAILADDMGLGKTVQSIYAAHKANCKRIFVVCPKSLTTNWQEEINKWCGDSAKIWSGNPGDLVTDVVLGKFQRWNIINYETFKELCPVLTLGDYEVDCLIFDEFHKLRNHDTKLYKMVYKLCKSDIAMRIYGLTGTPMFNYPTDLFNLLKLLYPMAYTNRQDWLRRHFNVYTEGWGAQTRTVVDGLKNQSNFHREMSCMMMRRLKNDVIELPERTYNIIPIQLEGKQSELYRQMEVAFWAELGDMSDRDLEVFAPNILSQIIRLKQIAVSPDIMEPESDKLTGAKIERTLEILQEIGDQKVVIFSQFSTVTKRLSKLLESKGIMNSAIDGGLNNDERDYQIRKFKTNENCNVFIATTKTGGVGLNLTEATHVIFLDLEWAPAHNNQAIDRVHRIGQDKKVTIHTLLIKNSIEDRIVQVLKAKEGLFTSALPTMSVLKGLKKLA